MSSRRISRLRSRLRALAARPFTGTAASRAALALFVLAGVGVAGVAHALWIPAPASDVVDDATFDVVTSVSMGVGNLIISGQAPGGAPLVRRAELWPSMSAEKIASAEACHRAAVLMMTRPSRFRLVTVAHARSAGGLFGCRLEVR
jgi:hypothetical protein